MAFTGYIAIELLRYGFVVAILVALVVIALTPGRHMALGLG